MSSASLFEYLLRLGDDRLVLGHRLSEWCGHGPILEEDIALANTALDFIGQANLLLGVAGTVEGAGRDADALAYLRDATAFRNHPLVELPNGDYAVTMMRSFLFDAFDVQLTGALQRSNHGDLAGIAAKCFKEASYHVRHSGEWVLRFGDGTAESHRRAQEALDELWRWTGTLFMPDDLDRELVAAGVAPDLGGLQAGWQAMVTDVLTRATLDIPKVVPLTGRGYRRGEHTEHLGHLLAEMQVLQRQYPGAAW
jgi:ring-1,2-phenylacetyl-CoA epoxidase subunit PaaC